MFQFILGFYIAYLQVGVAIFAAGGYILLLAIVNGLVSRLGEKYQVCIFAKKPFKC